MQPFKVAVVINGPPRAGKDTVVEMAGKLTDHFVHNVSSVTQVKKAARLLGWDGIKDGRGRQFLSDLKDISTIVYDGPFKYMLQRYEEIKRGIVFFHIREPGEIANFVCATNARTLFIDAPFAEHHTNHADTMTRQYSYDYVINNDGTLEDLREKVRDFVDQLLLEFGK